MKIDRQAEVRRHLKADPERDRVFLLIEPHLLYLSDEQASAYLEAMDNEEYAGAFHGPTVEIIKENLSTLLADAADGVALIDLGPGYPDKSLPMVQYLKERSVPCRYVPVDVSRPFLDLAARHVEPFVEQVHPVFARFEECASHIPAEVYRYTAYCLIGLTFMNFAPETVLPLLKSIAGPGGRAMVASELLSARKTPEQVLASYRTREAQAFGFGPLELLGLRENEFTHQAVFTNGRVELQYKRREDRGHASQTQDIEPGDTVVTAVSYRYTMEQLDRLLGAHFRSHRIFASQDGGTAVALAQV